MQDPIQLINDSTSLALRFQGATGFAFPPFIPLRETVSVKNLADSEANAGLQNRLKSGLAAISAVNWQMPTTLELINSNAVDPFTLPVDPIISLNGKNVITRRSVAKGQNRGTIKERFAQDDWEVSISGVLIGETVDDLYDQMETMRYLCEQSKNGLSITNEVLNSYMDIYRVAVETFDFPFTKGELNQTFTLKCYSDDGYTLLEQA